MRNVKISLERREYILSLGHVKNENCNPQTKEFAISASKDMPLSIYKRLRAQLGLFIDIIFNHKNIEILRHQISLIILPV